MFNNTSEMIAKIFDDPAKILEMKDSEIKALIEEKINTLSLYDENDLSMFDDYNGEVGDEAIEFGLKKARELLAEEILNFKQELENDF
jgi:hypothetical protein